MKTFQEMTREDLRAECRVHGIKYSALTVAQMRETLTKLAEPVFASDAAEDFFPAAVTPAAEDTPATPVAADTSLLADPAAEFGCLFMAAPRKSKCATLRYVAHHWTWSRKDFIAAAVARGIKEATASANYAAAKRGEE